MAKRIPSMKLPTSLADVVQQCDDVMAHAWMVRTFIKHSEEGEDYTELMEIVRTVFDSSRALETRVDDPPAYLHMLRKKIGKLRAAAAQFAIDAPKISMHTNFAMAVRSMNLCVRDLEDLLKLGQELLQAAAASSPIEDASGDE